ncbi:hypothetical protein WJX75_005083 [Coccomyxa subellipsoidea]|uniref:AAA+ ATPase domain-containing protein n=1 Tax=Coccomyxa subellipsoidea TaxID=248742 RepID=A0ABR2YPV8_9CHLO
MESSVNDEICRGSDSVREDGLLCEEDGTVTVRDSLDALLLVLPEDIREPLVQHQNRASLLEVVLDLGRRPEARFLGVGGGEYLRDAEITWDDLKAAEDAVGDFGSDNRAGVQGTLHRISAMRSRKGTIVGLTCRVGRAVTGHVDMIRDILDVPNSVLFLGRPGVGKTTVIREMARILSDDLKKRVVIVDTSNEIGGDGDVPHPAIGGARRMQVPDPSQQHKVMVEAVENHMPEIVIVDEIGTEAEALACRTIAERGVQLIATAHGQLLENLLKNPTLSDLVGGIQSVTLGDEEARARGTQKSVLERKAPPTFPLVIEMRERAYWVTHWVEDSVDCLLHGKVPVVQVRQRDKETREVKIEERRYDKAGQDAVISSWEDKSSSTASGESVSGLGDVASPLQAGFGSSYITDDADSDNPYAWAQRLREIPDKDALHELAVMGYTSGDSLASTTRRTDKFAFANGTGTGRKNNKRRPDKSAHARRLSSNILEQGEWEHSFHSLRTVFATLIQDLDDLHGAKQRKIAGEWLQHTRQQTTFHIT